MVTLRCREGVIYQRLEMVEVKQFVQDYIV